jgi:hypothetical protein
MRWDDIIIEILREHGPLTYAEIIEAMERQGHVRTAADLYPPMRSLLKFRMVRRHEVRSPRRITWELVE